jgi:hypothetical protein
LLKDYISLSEQGNTPYLKGIPDQVDQYSNTELIYSQRSYTEVFSFCERNNRNKLGKN